SLELFNILPRFVCNPKYKTIYKHYKKTNLKWKYIHFTPEDTCISNKKHIVFNKDKKHGENKNNVNTATGSVNYISYMFIYLETFDSSLGINEKCTNKIREIMEELNILQKHLDEDRNFKARKYNAYDVKKRLIEIYNFHKRFFEKSNELIGYVSHDPIEKSVNTAYKRIYDNLKKLSGSMVSAYNKYLKDETELHLIIIS
ncbi:hypothetical protein CDIK_4555, partial [Cucumispora dikerogammari]